MKDVILMKTRKTIVVTVSMVLFFLTLLFPLILKGAEVSHWAQIYVEDLSKNHGVDGIFKDKDLNGIISEEDFQNLVRRVIEEEYDSRLDKISREAVVHELTGIWADKTGQDLDKIPVIKILLYADTEEIEMKYNHGIIIAYMKDIAKGKGKGIFAPKDGVTYGELAALVYNTEIAIKKELKYNEQFRGKGSYETKVGYELQDGKVVFSFQLINCYNVGKQLQFGSGQQFELVISDDQGEEVYRYSDDKFFTMALVYKNIKPGESLSWQDEWDLTDKEGKKVSGGKYHAVINILANPVENVGNIPEEQLVTGIDFTLPFSEIVFTEDDSIIRPEYAEEIIKETADEVILALGNKDAEKIAESVHPVTGVRFTPYTYVSPERDIVFNNEEMKNFFKNQNSYLWGYYDGSGNEILLRPVEYYEEFIYSEDFIEAEEIGYNEVLSTGNMLENQFEVYKNPILVEYYFPGFNPDYAGMDWKSLRLIFEEYKSSWKLTGIIHNQWTI